MIIIEVNRDFKHSEKLLGEHNWSKMLKKPTFDEKGTDKWSRIFYCRFAKGREVEKNGTIDLPLLSFIYLMVLRTGWKRKMVEDEWFSGYDQYIKYALVSFHKTALI
jgi:hypothetical protein